MTTHPILFGTNGIRGVVNKDLTPELITKLGVAIGTYFNNGEVLLGSDTRTSNSIFSKGMIAGLASAGTHVYDTGLAPTPAIQFAVKHYQMDGAVIITASHNPPDYNGVKVVASDGVEIPREDEIKIEEIFHEERFTRKSWDKLGIISNFSGVITTYKEAVKSHVDVTSIKNKHFKVVVDPINSVGGLVTPYLLRELGCDVTTINADLDGHFQGRLPEPKPDTLQKLEACVKTFGADLGIAHDGDADRCIFVDEKGSVCLGDKSGAVIIDYVLEKHPNSVVVTSLSSSKIVEDVVLRRNSKIRWTKVGSTQVSREMLELNSIISMEDNGGIFYGPHHPVRDGAMAALLMLEILAKRDKPLSELVAALPQYYIIKERLNCPNELKSRILEKLLEETNGYTRITIDGVKLFFDDGSLLLRPSGTESVYRIYAEAKLERRARELADWGLSLVKKASGLTST